MEDTKTPVFVGIIAFVINFVASLALMGAINVDGNSAGVITRMIASASVSIGLVSLGHGGLALATTISSLCNFFILLLILHRRLEGIPLREVSQSFLRNLISTLLMATPLFWLAGKVDWTGTGIAVYSKALILACLICLGISLYLGLSYLLRSTELQILDQFRRSAQSRLRRG